MLIKYLLDKEGYMTRISGINPFINTPSKQAIGFGGGIAPDVKAVQSLREKYSTQPLDLSFSGAKNSNPSRGLSFLPDGSLGKEGAIKHKDGYAGANLFFSA